MAQQSETLNDLALKEWITRNAPDGIMAYPDGTIWVVAGWSSTGTEYGLLAEDLKAMQPTGGYVWLLANHADDKTVKYRTTRSRLYFNCGKRTYRATTRIIYGADGAVLSQDRNPDYIVSDDIVPGTMAARWYRMACPYG